MSHLRRVAIAAATVACMALGVAGALRVVGWSHLSPQVGQEGRTPIAFDDYALQFYYGQLGARFLAEGGVSYGYDPNFMAGYPKTPIYYPSSKPYELSLFLFSGVDAGTVFNRTVLMMLAAIPFLTFASARNFRLSPGEGLVVVAFSAVPHILAPIAGFYSLMEAAGMVSFIFASFLSLYVVSLVNRYLRTGDRIAGGALLIAAPLLFLTHLTAVVITAIPISAIYLPRVRKLPFRRQAWLWLVLGVVIAANWFWIEGYLMFSHYADLGDFYTQKGSQHFVPRGGLLAPFRTPLPVAGISLIPPLLGVTGLLFWWRERNRAMLAVFLPQILFLFVVAFYGALLGMNAVGPARMTLPLGLYLFFPAAHGLIGVLVRAREWIRRSAPSIPGFPALGALVAALLLLVSASGLPGKIWRPYSLPMLEQREGFSARGMAFLAWLRDNTSSRGRILHEETNREAHQYYGAHLPGWIPYFTGREMAGGPAPHALLKHNFLRFEAGTFRGRPIQQIGDKELFAYFSLYNVRWLLCWTKAANRRIRRLASASFVGRFDKFTLYRIEVEPSYFLQGSGELEVKGSRIRLRDLKSEDGAVAIKYHWLESLRTDPPRSIEPLPMLDDPVPFIRIQNPPHELVIFNDFDYGLFDDGG